MTATITDLFCGAGGSSLGARHAGAELVMAANHWQTAIDVHQAHFPEAGHDCADISQADPRRYPRTDILLASPECFPAGTLVTTRHGQVPIEHVAIGDHVLTHMGRWQRVVRTQSRYADTVLVKGQGHSVGLEVTPNHSLWARTSRKRWHPERREFAEPGWLRVHDLAGASAYWSTPAAQVPSMPQWPVPIGQDDAAWWVVGRWLGDGSLTFGRNHEVLISCGNHEADELEARLGDTALTWARDQQRTAVVFRVGHRGLRDWLHEHFGHGSANKGLPGWILGLTADQRTELLEGYVSADGHRSARRTRLDTVSKKLAVSVRLLAESLGYRAGLYRYAQHATTIEGRNLNVLDVWVVAWENNRSSREAFEEDGEAWSAVRSVEPCRERVQVFNIEVAFDHSYVADGIVVANCTNHSQARGVSRKRQDKSLWDAPDPTVERSRATMWDVVRFAEQMHYAAIVVENVVEATKWVLFPAWLQALTDLGYRHRILCHNSMHHGVPQSRDRIYIVWTRTGVEVDLDLELTARCPSCNAERAVRQTWKPGRRVGRYRQQWLWSCTACGASCEPDTEPAASIIDWELDCPRIGDRARPLAPATRTRILAGLQRYGWAPITTSGAGNVHERTPGNRARSVDEPLPVQQATATSALATPPESFVVPMRSGRPRSHTVEEPMATVLAGGNYGGLVLTNRTHSTPRSVDEPLTTLCAGGNHHGLIVRNYGNVGGDPGRHVTPAEEPIRTVTTAPGMGLLMRNNGTKAGESWACTPLDEPARSMTTKGHQSLLVPYNGDGRAQLADVPIRTVTGSHRWSLVDPDTIVDDCGFRMLEPYEIAAAMAFPRGYIPRDLPKKDQVKLAGNAVTPPVMAWIVGRILQALEAAA